MGKFIKWTFLIAVIALAGYTLYKLVQNRKNKAEEAEAQA